MPANEAKPMRISGEIGKLTLEINPEALKHVIADGRLMEFAATVANEAAAQISAQLVDKVAGMAVGAGGGGVGATFVLEGGDYATIPPRPKFGVGPIRRFDSILQRLAVPAAELPGAG